MAHLQNVRTLGILKFLGFLALLSSLFAQPAAACSGNGDGSAHNCSRFTSILVSKDGPYRFAHNGGGNWWFLVPLPNGFIGEDGQFHDRITFEFHAKDQHYFLPGDALANPDLEASNPMLDYGRAVCEEQGLALAGQSKKDNEGRTQRYSYWYYDAFGMVKHDRHVHRLYSVLGAREIEIRSDVSGEAVTGVICN